jgi:hypothetical protein
LTSYQNESCDAKLGYPTKIPSTASTAHSVPSSWTSYQHLHELHISKMNFISASPHLEQVPQFSWNLLWETEASVQLLTFLLMMYFTVCRKLGMIQETAPLTSKTLQNSFATSQAAGRYQSFLFRGVHL